MCLCRRTGINGLILVSLCLPQSLCGQSLCCSTSQQIEPLKEPFVPRPRVHRKKWQGNQDSGHPVSLDTHIHKCHNTFFLNTHISFCDSLNQVKPLPPNVAHPLTTVSVFCGDQLKEAGKSTAAFLCREGSPTFLFQVYFYAVKCQIWK